MLFIELRQMNQRSLRYTDGKSDKFWEIQLVDTSHTVRYGRHGTAGQTQTKDFSTGAEALKSYEKLVAEKLKKGYVDDDAAIEPAQTLTTPAKSAQPKATKVPAESVAAAIVEPSEPAQLNYPPVRSIHLEPQDWFWDKSRQRERLPRPEVQPFDLSVALSKVAKIRVSSYGWDWDWSQIDVPLNQSEVESRFWLVAMTTYDKAAQEYYQKSLPDSPDHARKLTAKMFSQTLHKNIQAGGGVENYLQLLPLKKIFNPFSNHKLPPEIVISLVNLFPLSDILKELRKAKTHQSHMLQFTYDNLMKGLKSYIFPYIHNAELEKIRHELSDIDCSTCPSDYYSPFSWDTYLAAYLGWHQEADTWISQWPDDYYSSEFWHDHYHKPQWIILGLPDVKSVSHHMRRLKLDLNKPDYLAGWIARTKYAELDWVCRSILKISNKEDAVELINIFVQVKAPEAAPYILELMLSSKAPQIARQWLEANPDHAIAGLIPTAAGKGKLAEAAIDFLRSMKRKGHTAYIQTCIDHESAEIAAKIRSTILDVEEKTYSPFDAQTTPEWLQQAIEQAPPKPTKKPSWNITPLDLPPIVIGTERLNDSQIEILLNTLRQSKLDNPPPLLTSLKTHADRTVLDAFSWKLFEAWLAEGAPSKENWAMTPIGLLGTDTSALKLAPMIRVWPGESQHQRAVLGLECLRTIGTDTALMQINGIAQKVKFKGIKQRAQECMEAIAQGRGMTRAELEDRIVPDCDLDAAGTRIFDFGDRQFRFVLGTDLKPMLKDADSKIKSDLPKPNSKDDAAKAELAIADWKLFKKQLSEIVKLQPARLEQAMITGRRWAVNDFITLLVQHPLMTHLVQRLIWGAYDASGKLIDTFRVTEDRAYADRYDATFSLDPIAQIGIVHPLHLSAEILSSWGEILSDYEIVAAFPQLGRAIHSLEPSEVSQTEITRFKDAKVPAVTLVGMLEKSGWARGVPQDGGVFCEHSKPFYGANVTAIVQYYGVPVGYMEGWEDQSIERCFFLKGIYTPQMYPDHKKAIGLHTVDPIVISEVLQDLTAIAAKAK
jgi:predicted DNA-binding WGR domain protein